MLLIVTDKQNTVTMSKKKKKKKHCLKWINTFEHLHACSIRFTVELQDLNGNAILESAVSDISLDYTVVLSF